jgi:hypothetical protein
MVGMLVCLYNWRFYGCDQQWLGSCSQHGVALVVDVHEDFILIYCWHVYIT